MKLLLLCNQVLSSFDCAVIQSLRTTGQIELVGVLVNTRSKGSLLKRARKEFRKGRGGYVLVQALRTILRKTSKSKSTRALEYFRDAPIFQTDSLYRDDVYEWIKDRNADCIFLRGFGIIKEPILSICPYGVLSYHHGDLKKYRGGPPGFWELYNNEREIGVTIQRLDSGLDTGTIIVQKFFSITKADSWSQLRDRIYAESTDLAVQAFDTLKATGPVNNPVGPVGRLYTLPNFTQWLTLHFKIFKRRMAQ